MAPALVCHSTTGVRRVSFCKSFLLLNARRTPELVCHSERSEESQNIFGDSSPQRARAWLRMT
jgi:hypothetical protein